MSKDTFLRCVSGAGGTGAQRQLPYQHARPNPRVDRNVAFVDGPVNHFASAFVPGGAVPGAPDPAWLGLASSDGDVVRGVETTEAAAEENYRRDQEKRGTAAKL